MNSMICSTALSSLLSSSPGRPLALRCGVGLIMIVFCKHSYHIELSDSSNDQSLHKRYMRDNA